MKTVKEKIESTGLNQSEFAKAVGVDGRTVRRWVANDSAPALFDLAIKSMIVREEVLKPTANQLFGALRTAIAIDDRDWAMCLVARLLFTEHARAAQVMYRGSYDHYPFWLANVNVDEVHMCLGMDSPAVGKNGNQKYFHILSDHVLIMGAPFTSLRVECTTNKAFSKLPGHEKLWKPGPGGFTKGAKATLRFWQMPKSKIEDCCKLGLALWLQKHDLQIDTDPRFFVDGELMRLHRASNGMSQADLANEIKVSQRRISDIENGFIQIMQPEVVSIAEALGVDIGLLMIVEDE